MGIGMEDAQWKEASFVAALSLYKNVAVVSSRAAWQLNTSLTTDVFIRAP